MVALKGIVGHVLTYLILNLTTLIVSVDNLITAYYSNYRSQSLFIVFEIQEIDSRLCGSYFLYFLLYNRKNDLL